MYKTGYALLNEGLANMMKPLQEGAKQKYIVYYNSGEATRNRRPGGNADSDTETIVAPDDSTALEYAVKFISELPWGNELYDDVTPEQYLADQDYGMGAPFIYAIQNKTTGKWLYGDAEAVEYFSSDFDEDLDSSEANTAPNLNLVPLDEVRSNAYGNMSEEDFDYFLGVSLAVGRVLHKRESQIYVLVDGDHEYDELQSDKELVVKKYQLYKCIRNGVTFAWEPECNWYYFASEEDAASAISGIMQEALVTEGVTRDIPAPYNKFYEFDSEVRDEDNQYGAEVCDNEGCNFFGWLKAKKQYIDTIQEPYALLCDFANFPVCVVIDGRLDPVVENILPEEELTEDEDDGNTNVDQLKQQYAELMSSNPFGLKYAKNAPAGTTLSFFVKGFGRMVLTKELRGWRISYLDRTYAGTDEIQSDVYNDHEAAYWIKRTTEPDIQDTLKFSSSSSLKEDLKMNYVDLGYQSGRQWHAYISPDEQQIQISASYPYDEAKYNWARSNNGGYTYDIILDGRIVDHVDADPDHEFVDIIAELTARNKSIEPRMSHN